MRDIPLAEYAKDRTQTDVAQLIGVTQGGLSQMLRSDRQIFVRLSDTGDFVGAYEKRSIGSAARSAA